MHASSRFALSALALLAVGCRIQTGSEGLTPTPSYAYYPSPSFGEDPSGDDDLTILEVVPVDGARYLPPAFQIRARFSEPYLGKQGDIVGRFGPTCEVGVTLQPQLSEDGTEVVWNMSAEPGQSYCFDLTVLSDLYDPAHLTSRWETAPCGVSFDAGRSIRFESIAGDTQVVAPLNAALAGYYFPLMLSFPGVERTATFPLTSDVAMGRILQVYADTGEGEPQPTGSWALDPVNGASGVFTGCRIDRDQPIQPWTLSCSANAMDLPISVSIGSMLSDGAVLDAGEAVNLTLHGVQLSANASEPGDFLTLTELTLSGGVAEADLQAIIDASGDGELGGQIKRLDKDADTDGDGTPDGYSVVMGSGPVWIPTLGCDSSTY